MDKQKIKINNTALNMSKIIEVNGDFIVPDTKPDIVSIISSNANAYIYKKEISNSKLKLEGNIDIYTTYLADTGETRSIQTTLSFNENIVDDSISEKMNVSYQLYLKNLNAKMLNERKISLNSEVEISLLFKNTEEIEIVSNINDIANVEKLEDKVEIKEFIGRGIGKASIKENIIFNEKDELAEIIKTNIKILSPEGKISYNKVLAKAEAEIKIIYLTEDDRACTLKEKFPVMSFIDIENVKEEYKCNIDYKIKNISFTPNSKEQHSINVFIEWETSCEVFKDEKITILKDIYGTKENIKCKNCSMCIENSQKNKEIIQLNEKVFVEDILKVIDIDFYSLTSQMKKTNNSVSYEGELIANILYEADSKRGVLSQEVKIPFIYKKQDLNQVQFRVLENNYTLTNEDINLEIKICVEEINEKINKIEAIQDIEIEENIENNQENMVIYFIKPNDTIWSVGKNFKVSKDNILKFNDLENEELVPGNKLYIVR